MTLTAQRTLQANPAPIEHAQYGGTSYHSTRAELARQVAQEHARARPQSD
ncbi:hypothetical protein [Pseudomonas putida]|uniref:Uncharacterized protein n=1 Tax=Pseudomonas putida TaxID=303 RepID=A0A1L7NPY3_PSEPU|nr:hypothetical protein [Pseudomonas putida]BAW27503.1 hypothetical protein KF715C_pC700 [Pseudomonas putida]